MTENKANIAQPEQLRDAKNKKDWREPTTFIRRFGDAMQALCGGLRPTDEMMTAWLDVDADDMQLQDFACDHGLSWAQGIGMIDAALLLADQPTEGVDHEYRPKPVAQPEHPAPVAWQWLDTGHFRKTLPKTAVVSDWNPLFKNSTAIAQTKAKP